MSFLFGTEVIEALQTLSPTLDLLFILLTFLGEEYVLVALIAITYWCFNKRVGLVTTYVLLLSAYLNYLMKMTFNTERPPKEYRIIMKGDISHGFPSGHAQNAVTFWGWALFKIRKARIRVLFPTLIFLISLSRIYLGVHYIGDVLGGVFLGAVFLTIAYKMVPYVESRLVRLQKWMRACLMPVIAVLLFIFSLALYPETAKGNPALICGYLFGFSIGVSLESRYIKTTINVDRWIRVIRSVLGGVVVFGLYHILNFMLLGAYLSFMRYAIVGFTIAFIMPIIFRFIEHSIVESKVEL